MNPAGLCGLFGGFRGFALVNGLHDVCISVLEVEAGGEKEHDDEKNERQVDGEGVDAIADRGCGGGGCGVAEADMPMILLP